MKFLAAFSDQGATDTFNKILETVCKLCKDRLTVRIDERSVHLINADFLRSNGTYLQITLHATEFFSTYIMGGVSSECNEIVMELDKDHLLRSTTAARDQSIKIRLTKIGCIPHLKIEQKLNAVVHEIPIELIPTKQWRSSLPPDKSGVKVSLFLPPLSTFRSLIVSLKNMGAKHLMIKANRHGELQISGDMESAEVSIYFSDLSTSVSEQSELVGDETNNTMFTVRVDIRAVYALFRSLLANFTLSRTRLRIIPEKMAIFSIDQADATLFYAISGVVL
ncbi:hypothetical protein AB6A40_010499 [Gnathostoma spinigerum]|uniref:Checkpoint protein n=1 Tax=Gnathostoma spinigerum TaxID=75299 RepID=A0ABD6F3D9_9BILA